MATATGTPTEGTRLHRDLAEGETRIVLRNIDWALYEALGERMADGAVRMTYDGRALEFMTTSSRHEFLKSFAGEFVAEIAKEWDECAGIIPLGSTTWKSLALAKGLEADQCYYLDPAKLATVAGRVPDQDRDATPDVAIEIEITSSPMDKMAIYAALEVVEVWRYDGEAATISRLGEDGAYHQVETSRFLPVTADDLARWLETAERIAELRAWTRQLRAWIRDDLNRRERG